MSTFIEELYYGNIETQELNSELSARLKNKLSEFTEKEEQLTAKLTDEDKELFLDYANTYNEVLSLSNSDSFISSLRLGAKFTYDTFVTD